MSQSNPLPTQQVALIICIALCLGPLFFAVLVLVVTGGKMVFDTTKLISLIGVALSFVSVVASFFAWRVITTTAANQIAKLDFADAESRNVAALGKLQTALIIRYALIEGAVFFLLLASMIEKNLFPWCIGVLLIGLMLTLLPLPTRYEAMVEKIAGHRV